jgi:hypothetical protein
LQGRTRKRLAAVAGAVAVLAVPSAARAQSPVVQLDGTPLNVAVDGAGGLQVYFDGSETGEFCCSFDTPAGNGFAVRHLGEQGNEVSLPDDDSGTRTASAPPAVTGPDANGTRTITSTYDLVTLNSDHNPDLQLHVVETETYTDGTHDVLLHFEITNTGDTDASFSAGELADLFVSGSDSGVGAFQQGPPRFIGGTGDLGGVDGLLEVPGSEWTHFEEGFYHDVFGDFASGRLTDTWLSEDGDNEAGVEWAVDGLAPGATVPKDVVWRFNPPAGPTPPHIAGGPVSGSTVTLTGTAQPGDTVTILEGGTPVGSPAMARSDGVWTVVLTGVSPGSHTYTAVAKDAAGGQSAASSPFTVTVAATPAATPTPTPTPTATPTPLPPPVTGKRVNAQTKSGTVKIKLPGTNAYIVLGPGQQIPTGTVVDTTRGRMTLTTAVGGGRTQHADFYQGIFKVTQSRGRTPLTTLALAGPKPACRRAGKASAAAKKKQVKTRRLWGSGHGSFRTKGQYSSATVRGTTWLTQDSCAGTLTRVTQGVVQVQDLVRHKHVLVRAPHHYLARARRR